MDPHSSVQVTNIIIHREMVIPRETGKRSTSHPSCPGLLAFSFDSPPLSPHLKKQLLKLFKGNTTRFAVIKISENWQKMCVSHRLPFHIF